MAELGPGIGERQRVCAAGQLRARKQPRQPGIVRFRQVDAEPLGKRTIEGEQLRRRRRRGLGWGVKAFHHTVEAVVEGNLHGIGPVAAAMDKAKASDNSVGDTERSEEHTSELQSIMRISYA